MKLKVKKLDDRAKLPQRNHTSDAGLDLYAIESCVIYPGETKKIRTGIAVQIDDSWSNTYHGTNEPKPKTYGLFIHDRSGLGSKGIHRFAGVCDISFRGEIQVVLHNANLSSDNWDGQTPVEPFRVNQGDKIAQLVIQEVFLPEVVGVEELNETDRGEKGWGSSGT